MSTQSSRQQVSKAILPNPWITPLYKNAISIYKLKFYRLPQFGLHLEFTPESMPYLTKPKPSSAYAFILLNIPVHLLLWYSLLHEWLYKAKPYSATDLLQSGNLCPRIA